MQNQPLPLYYQIKEDIVRQIENDELKADCVIPTEQAIMKNYGVSRTTVRKAIDLLINEGYVYILRGKGTYVKGGKFSQGLMMFSSCTEMLRGKGFDPTVKLIKNQVVLPSKKMQLKMQLNDEDKVFQIERVNYVDNSPINYTQSFISYKYVEGIEKYDFTKLSMYETLLKKYNIEIIGTDRTVEAVLPNEEIAQILEITHENPILKFNAIVYGKFINQTIIIESYKTYFRSDKSKFEVNIRK